LNRSAQQGKDQPTGRRVPRQAVSAAPRPGPGEGQGIMVSERRIPASVMEQYHAAIKRPGQMTSSMTIVPRTLLRLGADQSTPSCRSTPCLRP
jgi:hypothetical protein